MALIVETSNPQGLLVKIKQAILQGHVATWVNTGDNDFTHSPEQWKYGAWMRARINQDDLTFSIVRPKSKSVTKEIYAVYHGRFAEMLLAHFDTSFSTMSISSLAGSGDMV